MDKQELKERYEELQKQIEELLSEIQVLTTNYNNEIQNGNIGIATNNSVRINELNEKVKLLCDERRKVFEQILGHISPHVKNQNGKVTLKSLHKKIDHNID